MITLLMLLMSIKNLFYGLIYFIRVDWVDQKTNKTLITIRYFFLFFNINMNGYIYIIVKIPI